MQFIDEVKLFIKAGDGGNGAIAFRRERYRPNGGPSGGDGGNGGSVVFVADENVGTLLDLKYRHKLEAKRGENGQGKDCYGKSASDLLIRVPVGTVIYDEDTHQQVGDLTAHSETFVAAQGGKGGLGNIHFATPSNQAPQKATSGTEGEQRNVRLELKLLADVGLVGLPSVGKSSLISRMSAAKPKIAEYHFTTLVPNLGVVRIGPGEHFVMADIPGLIQGASEGAGLGIRFLRHIQRTAILVFVLALDATLENDLLEDFGTLKKELESFDPDLMKRRFIVVLNKSDIPETKDLLPVVKNGLADQNVDVLLVSAATHEGLDTLKKTLAQQLAHTRHGET